ncbi:MAG: hypothetical protein QNJ37_12070 [Crocosphaera sp.]|nr:hypothetical protein [Crocosphaera sp.]
MTFTNKLTIDKIIIWKGFGYPHQQNSNWDSKCRLRIWNTYPMAIVVSDLNEPKTGTSITNCSENLLTLVEFHFRIKKFFRFFEHYSYHNTSVEQKTELNLTENVCEVFFEYYDGHYILEKRNPFSRDCLETFLDDSISMDGYQTLKKVRLKTFWEHEQDEFRRGCSDAVNDGKTRDYPPHSQAYLNGFRYAIHQLSQRN